MVKDASLSLHISCSIRQINDQTDKLTVTQRLFPTVTSEALAAVSEALQAAIEALQATFEDF